MRILENMDYNEIEKKANDLLEKYWPNTLKGVDVVDIAKKMGFLVGNVQLDDNEDGFVIVNENANGIPGQYSNKLIGINANRTPQDKMFIIAHELGHYIFEREQSDLIYAHREQDKGRTKYENDIDYFAACLLMPADSFKKRYLALKTIYEDENENDIVLNELSHIFGVSIDSVKRRITETGVK